MRLAHGQLWSIPIVLDISDDFAEKLSSQNTQSIQLHDKQGDHIANLIDIEVYSFDKSRYCVSIF